MTRRKRWLTAAAGLIGLALDVGNLVLMGLARAVLTKRVPCKLCQVPTPTGQILNGGCCISCSLTDPEAQPARRSGWQGAVIVTPPVNTKPVTGKPS